MLGFDSRDSELRHRLKPSEDGLILPITDFYDNHLLIVVIVVAVRLSILCFRSDKHLDAGTPAFVS